MGAFGMKTGNFIVVGILLCFSLIFTQEYTPEQKQELGQRALHEMLQKIFSESKVLTLILIQHI